MDCTPPRCTTTDAFPGRRRECGVRVKAKKKKGQMKNQGLRSYIRSEKAKALLAAHLGITGTKTVTLSFFDVALS